MFYATTSNVIQLSSAQGLIAIAVFIFGIGAAWATLKSSVKHVAATLTKLEKDVTDSIKPDLKDVRERLATLEGKSQNLFAQRSPINLTAKGKKILYDSGVKTYIDEDKDLLIAACGKDRQMQTPYDVQQSAFEFFDAHNFPEEVDNELKTYAFNQGLSMDALRRIGAIYFRDLCLSAKGYNAADLDKPLKKA